MYTVIPCANTANPTHVRHEYFNSMKAGHHMADIICIIIRDVYTLMSSGTVQTDANVKKLAR